MARRYLARPSRLRLFCDALARSSGLGLSSYAHAAVRHSMLGRAHAVVVVMLRVYSSIIHRCARHAHGRCSAYGRVADEASQCIEMAAIVRARPYADRLKWR